MDKLLFSEQALKSPEQLVFEHSELGRIHALIPFSALATEFGAFKRPRHQGGRPPHLTIEGGLALMFLKHHLGLSDKLLVDRLNTDSHLQFFCFTRIKFNQPIRDQDLVGRWRRFFGEHLHIEALQKILAQAWSDKIEHPHLQLDDATCYESEIKYPTDVKLLFDCCEWLDQQLSQACNFCQVRRVRHDKYRALKGRVDRFSKMKKKRHKLEKRLRRSLLYWVDKFQNELQQVFNAHPTYHRILHPSVYQRLGTVRLILAQQSYMYTNNVRSVPNRIVSLAKPYIRPIIRGKEKKPYEFGAKVHVTQVGGLNFIEHLSFEAFHEGIRMWRSIVRNQVRFGQRCRQYGADRIYATNTNRKRARKLGVQTCFPAKGRPGKNAAQQRKAKTVIANARATRLEGSFGTEKQYYGLRKVKARTPTTEVAWIFFGIHTANAVRLARAMAKKAKSPPKAAAA
ncbi:MAG: transposase [Bacteroidota bacterium]